GWFGESGDGGLSNIGLHFRVCLPVPTKFSRRDMKRAKKSDKRKAKKRAGHELKAGAAGKWFEKLVILQAKLRAPDGCPWDREQTHMSLRTYLVEEAYEVLEALEGGDDGKFAEELGDLLLQVVFHAEIAREQGRFDAAQVIEG